MFPPKMREKEELNAERVCQARLGPWDDMDAFCEPERYCHGAEERLKEADKDRKRRSFVQGAES